MLELNSLFYFKERNIIGDFIAGSEFINKQLWRYFDIWTYKSYCKTSTTSRRSLAKVYMLIPNLLTLVNMFKLKMKISSPVESIEKV